MGKNMKEHICVHAQLLQLHPTLCDSIDYSQPGSSVHQIFFRQEYWSGLQLPSPGDLPDPGIKPVSPALTGGFFNSEPPGLVNSYDIINNIHN